MRRRFATCFTLGAVLAATMVWLLAASAVSAGDPCYHGYQMPASSTSTATTVSLEPCAFAPTLTNVPVGADVTFRNTGQFTHLITGANQAWGSRDAEVAPGKSVSYAFPKAGIYPYACALHRGMSGVIVVGDAAEIAATGFASTSGTTTTGSTTTAAAPVPAATTAGSDAWPLVALAAIAGVLLGGLGIWLLDRRRTIREGTVAAPLA